MASLQILKDSICVFGPPTSEFGWLYITSADGAIRFDPLGEIWLDARGEGMSVTPDQARKVASKLKALADGIDLRLGRMDEGVPPWPEAVEGDF